MSNETPPKDVSKVVSRILTEDILSLKEACEQIGKLIGKAPCKRTLTFWIRSGVRGVKLEAIPLGNSLFTSTQALTRFIEERARVTGLGE